MSITLQIDQTQDPTYIDADVTTPANRIYSTESGAEMLYEAAADDVSASGEMDELRTSDAVSVTVSVVCDL